MKGVRSIGFSQNLMEERGEALSKAHRYTQNLMEGVQMFGPVLHYQPNTLPLLSSNSDQPKEQDLLSHLVTNLSSFASTSDGGNLSRFLLESQNLLSFGAAAGTPSAIIPSVVSNCPESSRLLNSTVKTNGSTDAPCPQMRTVGQNMNCVASEVPQKEIGLGNTSYNALYFPKQTITSSSVKDHMAVNPKLTNIDLNSLCDDAQDCVEDMDMSQPPFNNETGSLVDCPSRMQKDSHQSSPPQTSGNSDSASAPSPSSSSGDQVYFQLCISVPVLVFILQ
ncbi:hypothetical protein GIB67_024811 [Kingdonia uniflora]|uniref:Uncharacterized protein n=1 Tax=Kingdonia uniflora TaxID=39325 RepID=A0A7J7NYD6_9MAGN|nr:hypothetical protein GIB67_024811 [Kingdonia uniflora]